MSVCFVHDYYTIIILFQTILFMTDRNYLAAHFNPSINSYTHIGTINAAYCFKYLSESCLYNYNKQVFTIIIISN